jgi:hypothetical protein
MEWGGRGLPGRAACAITVAGLMLAAGCTRPHPDSPADPATLFSPTGDPAALAPSAADDEGAPVDADAAEIEREPESVRVQTASGVKTVRRTRVDRRRAGDLTWFGRSEGADADDVALTVVDGSVAASIGAGADDAVTVSGARDRARLRKVRPQPFDADHELVIKPGETIENALNRHAGGRRQIADAPVTEDDAVPAVTAAAAPAAGALAAPNVIDVMVLYSAAADRVVNPARIQNVIDVGNMVFYASRIGNQYRLVHTEMIEASQMTSVDVLRRSTQVRALRDRYGADLVQAWGDFGWQFCGQGYQNTGRAAAEWAYSVVNVRNSYTTCIDTYMPPLHELGHNMGAAHDRKNTQAGTQGGATVDAYGYIPAGGQFATIMAYDGPPCPNSRCKRAMLFSNPNVLSNGIPAGRPGQENNAAALRLMGPAISAYRAPKA